MATDPSNKSGSQGVDQPSSLDETVSLEELHTLSAKVLRLYLTQANLMASGSKKVLALRLYTHLQERANSQLQLHRV